MGFFGFLKKKGIDAPKKPEGTSAGETAPKTMLPPTSHSEETSSSTPDPFADVPPLPDQPPLSDVPPPAPDGLSAFGTLPDTSQSPGVSPPAPDGLSAFGTLPDTSQSPAGQPPTGQSGLSPNVEVTDEKSSDASPAMQPLPRLDTTPVPDEKRSADAGSVPDDTSSSSPDETLPDFTEEEIAAAERLERPVTPAPHHHKEGHLPAFQDVEGKVEPALYVSASQYRDALRVIAKLKETTRSGAAGLKSFDDTLEEHKSPYLKFADTLNTVQEQLIAMDNVLLNQR